MKTKQELIIEIMGRLNAVLWHVGENPKPKDIMAANMDATLALTAAKELQERLEEDGWRDISTAPRDGTIIKCKGNEGRDYFARWAWSPNAGVNTWCGDVMGIVLPVTPPPTHYMPLPTQPTKENP